MSRKNPLANQLGTRIRDIRRKRNLTLIELSKYTGVAQATLSRMETGLMTGTVESHQKIAETLGISLAELYGGIDKRTSNTQLQTAVAPKKVTAKTDSMRYELLTQEISKKKITPLLLTLQSHGKTEIEQTENGVEKFAFVLDGNVTAKIGSEEYALESESSVYFDATLPHQFMNQGQKIARVLITVSPSKI